MDVLHESFNDLSDNNLYKLHDSLIDEAMAGNDEKIFKTVNDLHIIGNVSCLLIGKVLIAVEARIKQTEDYKSFRDWFLKHKDRIQFSYNTATQYIKIARRIPDGVADYIGFKQSLQLIRLQKEEDIIEVAAMIDNDTSVKSVAKCVDAKLASDKASTESLPTRFTIESKTNSISLSCDSELDQRALLLWIEDNKFAINEGISDKLDYINKLKDQYSKYAAFNLTLNEMISIGAPTTWENKLKLSELLHKKYCKRAKPVVFYMKCIVRKKEYMCDNYILRIDVINIVKPYTHSQRCTLTVPEVLEHKPLRTDQRILKCHGYFRLKSNKPFYLDETFPFMPIEDVSGNSGGIQ